MKEVGDPVADLKDPGEEDEGLGSMCAYRWAGGGSSPGEARLQTEDDGGRLRASWRNPRSLINYRPPH